MRSLIKDSTLPRWKPVF